MEKIMELSSLIMVFFTFLGVAGAIATYFSEVKSIPDKELAIIMIVYILVTLEYIEWARRKIK